MKTGSIGTTTILVTFGAEALQAIYDCRWLLALCFVMMIVDLWWAYSEHMYKQAHEQQDIWRKSRAIRRTAMKFVDYLTLMVVGVVLGLAVTEPLGICDHVTSAACGGLIGFTADIFSVVGHICVVKEWRTPTSFMKKFMVALVRTKNNDIAEALDETLNNKEENNGE